MSHDSFDFVLNFKCRRGKGQRGLVSDSKNNNNTECAGVMRPHAAGSAENSFPSDWITNWIFRFVANPRNHWEHARTSCPPGLSWHCGESTNN